MGIIIIIRKELDLTGTGKYLRCVGNVDGCGWRWSRRCRLAVSRSDLFWRSPLA